MVPVESDPSTSFHILIRKHDALASFYVDSRCNTLLPLFSLHFFLICFRVYQVVIIFPFFFQLSCILVQCLCACACVCVWGGTHLKTLEEKKINERYTQIYQLPTQRLTGMRTSEPVFNECAALLQIKNVRKKNEGGEELAAFNGLITLCGDCSILNTEVCLKDR